MSEQTSLQQINDVFKELQSQIAVLNRTKLLIQKKQKCNSLSIAKKDKKKILTLFQHSTWDHFMKWVNQKLVESGQNLSEQIQSERSLKNKQNTKNQDTRFDQSLDFELTGEVGVEEDQNKSVIPQNRKANKIATQQPQSDRKQQEELQLLALQNGRLRRENIILKNKLIEIRSSLPE